MKISLAESKVMEALWASSPLTADQVISMIGDEPGWAGGTVRTLLARLHNKGAIAVDRDGKRYNYRPLIQRDEYVAAERDSFLERLFNGKLGPLVVNLAKDEKISEEDLEEIKRIISELERES